MFFVRIRWSGSHRNQQYIWRTWIRSHVTQCDARKRPRGQAPTGSSATVTKLRDLLLVQICILFLRTYDPGVEESYDYLPI